MEKRPNDVDEALEESFPASDPPSYGSPGIDGDPAPDDGEEPPRKDGEEPRKDGGEKG